MEQGFTQSDFKWADSTHTFESTIASATTIFDPIDQIFHLCEKPSMIDDPKYDTKERWGCVMDWMEDKKKVEIAEAISLSYKSTYLHEEENIEQAKTTVLLIVFGYKNIAQ